MTLGKPEVSIIIPTRDRPRLLARTLASALMQEGVDAETIVVDDGSTTPVAVALPRELMQRVLIRRHQRSTGMASARNTGIEAARGVWLAFLDDDDLWAPTKLRRQIDAAQRVEADFAFAGGVLIDLKGTVLSDFDPPPPGPGLHKQLLASNVIPLPSSNVVARAELVAAVGGYDPKLIHLADWDLNIRLSATGSAAAVSERLVAATFHGTNAQLHQSGLSEDLRYLECKHATARATHGAAFDAAGWLRWRASVLRFAGNRRAAAAAYWRLGRLTRNPLQFARAGLLLLGGERAMCIAQRARRIGGASLVPAPSWLDRAIDPRSPAPGSDRTLD